MPVSRNIMTATFQAHGRIQLPKKALEEMQLLPGEKFDLTISARGDMHLRRIKPRTCTLIEHLRGFEGMVLNRSQEAVQPAMIL